jgi:hypothetical protein
MVSMISFSFPPAFSIRDLQSDNIDTVPSASPIAA